MKIIVPIDVWQGNESLASDLPKVIPLQEAELVLVYAIQSEPHLEKIAGGGDVDTLYQELEKTAKGLLAEFSEQLKPLAKSVEIFFEHGQPANVIESIAKRRNAELIVVRGSASGFWQLNILGSTLSMIMKQSPCPVMVLRPGVIDSPLVKVIVALDGSQLAKDALKKFCAIYKSWSNKTELVLANVVSIPAPWRYIGPVEFIATLEDNLDMVAEAILAEAKTIVSESGWQPSKEVEMVVRSGDPATELERLAGDIDANMIILAAQGKSALQHFLLGSVSEALALKSSFPVFVFK